MMSFKDFKNSKEKEIAASNNKVAGTQQTQKKFNLDQMEKQSLPLSAASSSGTSVATNQTTQMKTCKLYPFIGDTYRYIRRGNSGLNKDIYNTHLLETINKYKIECNKIYEDAFKSREMCLKLGQNIVRTIDLCKEMCTTYTNMEEYQHRICELMAIYIACELRLGVGSTTEEKCLIGNRIIYIMRKHLIQEEKDDSRYNILRTLVYIPRLFNAREIVCAIFEEFIPLTPVIEVNVFPDKLYMLYIIVFYRWMSMQKNTDAKNEIVKFAEMFMKPSATLSSNKLYALHLPLYKTYSTATRSILNNISYYKDIKNAAIIDNALKTMGSIVNLCDGDEDDDVIFEDTTKNIDFAEQFSSIQLEPLGCSFTNIKLEETTVVSTVDLTTDEEIIDCESSILEKHNIWLNGFQQTAKQFRDSQILIEKQQTAETQKVICLDSDSEYEEDDDIAEKETYIGENNKRVGDGEDLFVDNYALTSTPINCESDLETSDAEDMTKLSPRFLPGTLRTYQPKKDKETTADREIRSQTPESNINTESDRNMAYRRDSIHISSTPPQRSGNDEDDGTDVQDENDDDMELYTFLPTRHKKSEKELIAKEPKSVSLYPYPSINLNTEKVIFSQTNPRLQQHQRQQQYYCSDSPEVKMPKKSEQQQKRVHFNTSPLGPTSAYSSSQKHMPKPSLLQHKYKASDAPDYFNFKGSERFSSAASIAGSTSTTASTSTSSSLKQQQEQEHSGKNGDTNNPEIEQRINVNKRLNFNKNLLAFNKKSLNIKNNSKVKLCKVKLNRRDISLTNCKTYNTIKKNQPHTSLTDDSSSKVIKETEIFQLQTNIHTNNINNKLDDDVIFKRPLPVKEIRKSQKCPNKAKVLSFKKQQRSLKNTKLVRENKDNECVVLLNREIKSYIKMEHIDLCKEQNISKNNEPHIENENHKNDLEMDALSEISQLLTNEINSLTFEDNINISKNSVIENTITNSVEKKTLENNIQSIEQKNSEETEITHTCESIHKSKNEFDKYQDWQTSAEIAIQPNCDFESSNIVILNKDQEILIKKLDENLSNIERVQEVKVQGVEIENFKILAKQNTPILATQANQNELLDSEISKERKSINKKQEEQTLTDINMKKQFNDEINLSHQEENLASLNKEAKASNNISVKLGFKTKKSEIMEIENRMGTVEEKNMKILNSSEKTINQIRLEFETEKIMKNVHKMEILEEDNNMKTLKIKANEVKTKDNLSVHITKKDQAGLNLAENSAVEDNSKTKAVESQSTLLNDKTQIDPKLISNFSAEFLAGLPNETSPAKNDETNSTIANKNKDLEPKYENMDFEFKNNSSTSAMCRINLDSMSDNTSDIPTVLPLTKIPTVDCDTDNNKTKDIVGYTLTKTINKTVFKFDSKPPSSNKSHPKELLNNFNTIKKTQAKIETRLTNKIDKKKINKPTDISVETLTEISNNDNNQPKVISSNDETFSLTAKKEQIQNTNTPQHYLQTKKKCSELEGNVRVNDNSKCKEENKKNIKPQLKKESETLTPHIAILSVVNDDNISETSSKFLNLKSPSIELTKNCKIKKSLDEEFKEFDKEEEQEEDNDDENVIDPIEIEKFSHDSNSACSLPLKKRPTQSDTNDDAEDSQHIMVTNLEQTEEIAAEVIIENNDKDIVQLEENISIRKEEFISQEECRSKIIHAEFNDKPSTSAACFKNKSEPLTLFKRRVQLPVRPIGQPPIQVVAPQLKDNSPSPSHDHGSTESQASVAPRLQGHTQPLPESYPATPMLGVANIEILMDFNRFIEDLLASPDVMTIIDNANACGYYAEGQVYEMERIAILEHYNIANAKGNKTITKPLYWKKSDGDTISIFNDNDNEWISLPPSTARQLLKLSFVLSILQQQYKLNDVRQRINLALTFLIQTTYTSKLKPTTAVTTLQQRMQQYSRIISEANNSNIHNTQTLPSAGYFRIATNNDSLNTNFSMHSNMESVQDLHLQNFSNTLQIDNIQCHTQHYHPQHHHPQHNISPTSARQQQEASMQQESIISSNPNWNNIMQFSNEKSTTICQQQSEMYNTTSINVDQKERLLGENHQQQQDKRNSSWEKLTNDQLYIYPPCATSPQNEVIVNTNGVQLHDVPQSFQDQQNIFISITDDTASSSSSSGNTEQTHKYNTRQQQYRTLDTDIYSKESGSPPYAKRPCPGNNNVNTPLYQNHFTASSPSNIPRNIISRYGNQDIYLQNPYRMKQPQQQQRQQQHTNKRVAGSHNMQQNLPMNIYNNSINLTPLSEQQLSHHHMSSRYSSNINPENVSPHAQTKQTESSYRDILQPYITYLIKDHEKNSKHLLQIFEEVSSINPQQQTANTNASVVNNNILTSSQHQQMMLPPLIRNPQENHMPSIRNTAILPSLIRNPHHMAHNLPVRDSGALQVVQSFIDQTQPSYEKTQQQQQQFKNISNPDFDKEYVNFVGSRDDVLQKQKLRNYKAQQLTDQNVMQQQLQALQKQTELQRLNSNKRKRQERNDKLSEVLKHKMAELNTLQHNFHIKLLEKRQKQVKTSDINTTATTVRRGRPKKSNSKNCPADNNAATESSSSYEPQPTKIKRTNSSTRGSRCKPNNTDLPPVTSETIDHAYYKQRSAAREANKRISVCNKQF